MARRQKTPQLPAYVVIAGQKWSVELREAHVSETNTFGETDIETFTITIYLLPHRLYPKNDVRATLFHECLHAALKSTGLCYLLNASEEAVVAGLENALWPLIEAGAFK